MRTKSYPRWIFLDPDAERSSFFSIPTRTIVPNTPEIGSLRSYVSGFVPFRATFMDVLDFVRKSMKIVRHRTPKQYDFRKPAFGVRADYRPRRDREKSRPLRVGVEKNLPCLFFLCMAKFLCSVWSSSFFGSCCWLWLDVVGCCWLLLVVAGRCLLLMVDVGFRFCFLLVDVG